MLANSLNPLAPGEGIGKTGGLVLRDLLLILGSGLVLLILLLFWARSYVRRAKRVRHPRHHHRLPSPANTTAHPANETTNPTPTGTSQPGITAVTPHHRQRRRRRRRRDHRSRNPSLAEVGGLPPQRSGPAAPPDS
jgi:hypothetical protein